MGGEEVQRKCVRCMQGVCGGFGDDRPFIVLTETKPSKRHIFGLGTLLYTRRPRSLEAFCEGLERSTQLFIIDLACK
jgi:hypothetical protein